MRALRIVLFMLAAMLSYYALLIRCCLAIVTVVLVRKCAGRLKSHGLTHCLHVTEFPAKANNVRRGHEAAFQGNEIESVFRRSLHIEMVSRKTEYKTAFQMHFACVIYARFHSGIEGKDYVR